MKAFLACRVEEGGPHFFFNLTGKVAVVPRGSGGKEKRRKPQVQGKRFGNSVVTDVGTSRILCRSPYEKGKKGTKTLK